MVFFEKFIIVRNYQNETANPFHVEVTVSLESTEESSSSLHSQCSTHHRVPVPQHKTLVILLLMLALPDTLLLSTKVHFNTCKMSLQLHQRKFSAFMCEINFIQRTKNEQCVRFVEKDSKHFQKELQDFVEVCCVGS